MKNLLDEIARLIDAFEYSIAGLMLKQPAFRLEILGASIMVPATYWISGYSRMIVIASIMLVFVVETINTAIEAVVDRVSTEPHPLSKVAKDLGSAAVFLSLVNVGAMWILALVR